MPLQLWSENTSLRKSSLTPGDLKTVTNSDTLCLIVTANGTVESNDEATVHIKDLDIFLCVRLVDDAPAVLSLRMVCEMMGQSYS